jgi:hypothetical protein
MGTGVFVVPDIRSDDPEAVNVFYIEDINYEQCINRGALAIAFKWIPVPWRGRDKYCPDWCVDTCPPLTGCVCVRGRCVKPQSTLP